MFQRLGVYHLIDAVYKQGLGRHVLLLQIKIIQNKLLLVEGGDRPQMIMITSFLSYQDSSHLCSDECIFRALFTQALSSKPLV